MKYHTLPRSALLILFFLYSLCVYAKAAERVEKLDTNGDGKTDAWIYYDSADAPSSAGPGKAKNEKAGLWGFEKKPQMYKREWDRNGDGKPDFRIIMQDGHVIEKQYDDNFDGVFERTVKMPAKGDRIKTITTASGTNSQ